MKRAQHVDKAGRKWAVLLPDDAPDSHADKGVVIGPPSLDSLKLPRDLEVRLHNELYARGILTRSDALRMRDDVFGALQAVLGVDTGRIVQLYVEEGNA